MMVDIIIKFTASIKHTCNSKHLAALKRNNAIVLLSFELCLVYFPFPLIFSLQSLLHVLPLFNEPTAQRCGAQLNPTYQKYRTIIPPSHFAKKRECSHASFNLRMCIRSSVNKKCG